MGRLRLNRGVAAIGLALALALLAVLLVIRNSATGKRSTRVVDFQPIAARGPTPSATVPLQDVPLAKEQAATRSPQAGPRPAAPPSTKAAPSGPVAASDARVAFQHLSVMGDLTNNAVKPLVLNLPAATTRSLRPGDEWTGPVYVPGCVARAKRHWSGADGAEARAPVIDRHDGRCPTPDRISTIELPQIGVCAEPARDRGLPAMCSNRERRR
jgi:hypothetical protein